MRLGSEVTLNADVQADSVLVLELVPGLRLGSRRGEDGTASQLLVEIEVQDFGRERQVLDRSPAGDHADLRDVEVRVAAEVGAERCKACAGEGLADKGFRRVVVTDPGIAAEQAGRPVRIPVVVERTADAPGLRQMEPSVTAGVVERGGETEGE